MKRIYLILLLSTISLTSVFSIDHFMFEVETGVTWIHNEAYEDGTPGNKDPDPILYKIGFAFPLYISDSFFIRPSLGIISNSWKFDTTSNWALPVDAMWQDLMVMSLMLDVTAGYQLNFDSFSLGFFGGLAFDFKIPLWGEGEAVREDMTSYFYQELHFFNLNGGFFFVVPLSDLISLTIKGDTWVPIHNIWNSSGLPFSDGLMVSLSAGIRFTF